MCLTFRSVKFLCTYTFKDSKGPLQNLKSYTRELLFSFELQVLATTILFLRPLNKYCGLTILDQYTANQTFPINGPLEVRVMGLDDPQDVGIPGAESPSISASSTIGVPPRLDTVVWFDVLTYTRTFFTCHFMSDMEREFLKVFNGTLAVLRVEWSKGYACTTTNPWENEIWLHQIIPGWSYFQSSTKFYDPKNIFTLDLKDSLQVLIGSGFYQDKIIINIVKKWMTFDLKTKSQYFFLYFCVKEIVSSHGLYINNDVH